MRLKYLFMLVSFIVPVMVYFQTITFGYTDFDDNRLIKDNKVFLSNTSNIDEAFVRDAFITGTSHFYRPLQVVSYMFDIRISGGINPWMFHLTNVLLFGFISCALFLFLSNFGSLSYVLGVTLLFMVHPLFVPVVAWIPSRGDLLLTVFTLVAFLALEQYGRKAKHFYFIIHILAFILALFSKETAALLPILFILFYIIRTRKSFLSRKSITLIAVYFITGFIWYRIRQEVIGDISSGSDFIRNSGDEIIGITPLVQNLRTIPAAVSRFLIPVDLDLIPSFSVFCDFTGTLIIITILFLLIRSNKLIKVEKLLFVLWYIMLMLPPMFFKHKLIDYLDHRFMLPLIAILPAFIMMKPFESTFKKLGTYKYAVIIALVVSLSFYSFFRTRAYSDPMKFYTSAIRQNPSSPIAHNNLGALLHNRQKYDQAIKEYSSAILIKSDYLNAYNNRANAYLLAKRFKEAINDYTSVIKMDPGDENSYNNRGVAFLRNQQTNEACRDFEKAAELGSQSAKENLKRFCR